ncbi:MAG: hypothetical protein JWN24_3927 [Phycisphaerales bacterium]|nr:hypothetical protein [Phycisphaerales bacterium]
MSSAITIDDLDRGYGVGLPAERRPRPMPDRAPVRASSPARHTLGFSLFILLNAVLFVRPAEIIPSLEALPIYEVVILLCLLASIPAVLPQLAWSSLKRNPITLCVLGLLPAIFLSHLTNGDLWSARMGALMFLKVVIYYLLLVGLVNSAARLRTFLLVIAGFILCTAVLCLLDHHGIIDIPALSDLNVAYGEDAETGEVAYIQRLRAMGIFNDPNDFALILNAATFICLHWLISQKNWLVKIAWAIPIGILVYALTLTQSRGGFLSLMAGLLILLFTRIRPKRAVLIAACLLPAMLIAFGGRLTNIDVADRNDTAQGRIQLWRDSLVEFHRKPLFGIGQGNLADTIGMVAHNSYVHSYAELGFFGGTVFVGAFYLAFTEISALRPAKTPRVPAELRALRLCLLPVLGAYMMGIYSLSRGYGNSTYLVLGFAGAFLALIAASGIRTPCPSYPRARRLVLVSVGCVLYFELFVRIFAG